MWTIYGLKYSPKELGMLLGGRLHADGCNERLAFSYQLDQEGKPANVVISCENCGFRMEFEGPEDLEINLEVRVKRKER